MFVKLLKRCASVKTVSLEDRVQPDITQSLGTMEGSLATSFNVFQVFMENSLSNLTSLEEAVRLNKTRLGEYWDDTYKRLDGFGRGPSFFICSDRSVMTMLPPLQFISDCRILVYGKYDG